MKYSNETTKIDGRRKVAIGEQDSGSDRYPLRFFCAKDSCRRGRLQVC
ncbi:MAG: hypothetical protein P8P90_05495 [Opitutales bacterium]|nr:hypothetical protein [Opitutales bacterium]